MPPSTSSGGVEMSPDKRQYKSTRKKVAEMEFIPHDLDVDATIEQVDNFHPVHILDIRDFSGPEGTRKLKEYAEAWVKVEGKPLVLRNYHLHDTYPHHIFSPEWLIANHSRQLIVSRNLVNGVETQMSMGHYLKNMSKLTNTVIDADGAQVPQRLYAKDIDCPPIWKDKLKELLPRFTFYLEKSADLMVMLPPAKRAQNMLCYFGHEGTYTPAHKEMCGTVGHNLMVYSSTGENPGSSIWWMTKTEDRKKVADFWLELGHDIETEKHFTSLADWMDAPFPVYIHEQVEGDYILVPSMAPHQVWNRGVCTLKAAWNRVTVETLEYALSESLAKSRMVCRDEQYKCKAIVHETLREYARVLNGGSSDIAISQSRMESDFVRLFRLFDQMMLSECFAATNPPTVELLEMEDASVTCSFCRSDIWNRFLTCRSCAIVDEQETDCYDVCLDCYARGRSCYCVSGLNWVEQFRWSGLVAEHEEFRRIVVEIQNAANPHGLRPLALHRALKHLGRKTLAWVCQEQLEVRPYADPAQNGLEDEEGTDGDLALEKKRAGVTLNCHACKVQHDSWRVAKCSRCAKAYCYGNLWRGYDMDPFEDVLAVPQWICPVCLGICNCGACRRKGDMKPYQQVGTYLSKSTRAFSDPRSYEALVSFEKGNVVWREGNAKRKGAAEAEKTPVDPALGNSFPAVNTPARSLGRSPTTTEHDERHTSNTLGSIQTTARNGGEVARKADQNDDAERDVESDRGGEAYRGDGGENIFRRSSGSGLELTALKKSFSSAFGFMDESASWRGGGMEDSSSTVLQSHQHRHCPPLPSGGYGNNDHFGSDQNFSGSNISSQPPHQGPGQFTHPAQPSTSRTLTALESNPLAFIAAAGLMNPPGGGGDDTSLSMWRGSPMPMPIPTTAAPDQPHAQPPHLPEGQLQIAPSSLPATPEKPRIQFPRRSRVPTHAPNSARTAIVEREAQIGGWVRKTHAVNKWTKNLRRKKACLVVNLKLPRDRFREIMDDIYERDMVVSDLVSIGPGQYAALLPPAAWSVTTPVAESMAEPLRRQRGRPRKSEAVSSAEDENDFNVVDDEAVAAEKQKSTQRRREAYLCRKKEENEARAQFLASREQEELEKLARRESITESTPQGSARWPRNRVMNKEILDVLRQQDELHIEPVTGEEKRAREARQGEQRIARAAKAEEERARCAAEAEAERARREAEVEVVRVQRQEEVAARRAAELERQRVRVEEKALRKAARKAERAKLRAEEKDRRRQVADRHTKLATIGAISYDDVEEYVSSSSSEEEDDSSEESGQEILDYMEYNDELESARSLIPHNWPWAVIIDPLPHADVRDAYERFPEPVSTPPLTAGLANHSTPPVKRGRGRPKKHPLPGTPGYTPKPSHGSSTLSSSKPVSQKRKTDWSSKRESTFRATVGQIPPMIQRDRRKSAVVAAAGIKHSLEDEDVKERKVKQKKVIRKKVEVKPGLWGLIEITDSEGEGEPDENDADAEEDDIVEDLDRPKPQRQSEPEPEPESETIDQYTMELDLIGLTPEEASTYRERSRRQPWF